MLGGRTPAFDRRGGPPMTMSDVSTRADAHKVPGLRAASASPRRRCALSGRPPLASPPWSRESRRAPRTPEHYDSVTVGVNSLCRRPAADTTYCGEKCITQGKRPAALTASDESARLGKGDLAFAKARRSRWTGPFPPRHSPRAREPALFLDRRLRWTHEAVSPALLHLVERRDPQHPVSTPAVMANSSATTSSATPITAQRRRDRSRARLRAPLGDLQRRHRRPRRRRRAGTAGCTTPSTRRRARKTTSRAPGRSRIMANPTGTPGGDSPQGLDDRRAATRQATGGRLRGLDARGLTSAFISPGFAGKRARCDSSARG